MTQLLTIIKNNLTTIIAIVTMIVPILTYTGKTTFDLGFEERHTKFLAKCSKFLTATVFMYLCFQLGTIIISLILITVKLNSTIINIITAIDTIAFIFLFVYWIFSMIKLIPIKKFKWITKLISWMTTRPGVYIYIIVFVSSTLIQSLAWKPILIKVFNGKLSLAFTADIIQTLFIYPLTLTFVLLAILKLHQLNQGKENKYGYAMKVIDYNKVKNKNLIHLYSKKGNEWVFVEEKDFHKQKVLYLFEKDKEKWYEFTKIKIPDFKD
ncbi:hypothetical protein A6279_04330 [Bacillus wiedmannii]|uniref:hypothetical protein n=1 Tax=Bacillus TaxID=1386 RepID=UPI0007DB0144|nr:hypothetical protein [Bacillus wiedmannii]MED2837522.1 hypothetical protein [Bacillus wiedmannii]OAK10263.1 hypothetical protein A6278_00705 [Bacillus wiedmannii]OAK12102.1 hypothetical protein A6279_04330 [Bacillus wiedmannii]